jgi:two-component system NtrC family sensor kinase
MMEVVIAIASNDFTKRAFVGDGESLLDGLAAGMNMLAEEIGRQQARERAYHQQIVRTERLAAIGKLAAGVAHEVNNPSSFILANLMGIDGLLAKLEEPTSRADLQGVISQLREMTRDSLSGINRVTAIVRDLLDFSQPQDSRFEPLSVSHVVDDACRMARAEILSRARLHVECGRTSQVLGSQTKLTQVVMNLLLNAAHSIPDGALEQNGVTVATFERASHVVISVADTGSGIAPEIQARLFEPFFTTKSRGRGSGLGLAISADIVRTHKGDLSLRQTSRAGTTFEIMLPIHAEPAVPAVTPPLPPVVARRARVLLIDDEPLLLSVLSRFLRSHFHVETALGGRAGLETLERDSAWDVVICDLTMPDLDGPAIFSWASNRQPELAARMLFCTGGIFTPRGAAFSAAMGDRILQKPLHPDKLRAAIEQMDSRASGRLRSNNLGNAEQIIG